MRYCDCCRLAQLFQQQPLAGEVAALRGVDAYMVDNATYLKKEWFENKTKVGVTAGASAPEVLVREVLQTIQNWGHETIREGRRCRRKHCICLA